MMISTNPSDRTGEATSRGRDFAESLRAGVRRVSGALDDAASGMTLIGGSVRRPRRVKLVEQADGTFVLQTIGRQAAPKQVGAPLHIVDGAIREALPSAIRAFLAGSHVEIAMLPRRFIMRPLQLPRRAGDFLDGIVRAQIDRLTPWRAAEAVFGWSDPPPGSSDRVDIIVAAAAREAVMPIVRALAGLGAAAIVLSTHAEQAPAASSPIYISVQPLLGAPKGQRLRKRLTAMLILALLVFAAAVGASVLEGGRLDAEGDALDRQIAERMGALPGAHHSAADEALAALAAKKQATLPTVIVLEVLSKILPDNTYLTDFHVEGGVVRIAGLTNDAPALIRLVEQSQRFGQARFSAPTTQSPGETGEHFQIEAQIVPPPAAAP